MTTEPDIRAFLVRFAGYHFGPFGEEQAKEHQNWINEEVGKNEAVVHPLWGISAMNDLMQTLGAYRASRSGNS